METDYSEALARIIRVVVFGVEWLAHAVLHAEGRGLWVLSVHN